VKVGTSSWQFDDTVGELAEAEEIEAADSHDEGENLVMGGADQQSSIGGKPGDQVWRNALDDRGDLALADGVEVGNAFDEISGCSRDQLTQLCTDVRQQVRIDFCRLQHRLQVSECI
jgi:hypothetical protein